MSVFVVGLECPDVRSVIDSVVLEPADFLVALAEESDGLDVIARNLLVVELGVDLAHARSAWRPSNSIAAQNTRYASIRDLDFVIARQISVDPDRPEVIFAS